MICHAHPIVIIPCQKQHQVVWKKTNPKLRRERDTIHPEREGRASVHENCAQSNQQQLQPRDH